MVSQSDGFHRVYPWGTMDDVVRDLCAYDGKLDGTSKSASIDGDVHRAKQCVGGSIKTCKRSRGRLHVVQVDPHFVESIAEDKIEQTAGIDKYLSYPTIPDAKLD